MVAYLLTTPSRCGIFYGNTPPAIGGVIPFLIPLIFKSHKFEKSKMAKSLFYSFLTVFHFKKSTLRLPYFNEGSLLKAMERPDKYFDLKDKKSAQTLKVTGGIGTVATRADIIDKLFHMNAIESQDGKIKVTSKGKQILDLAPESLTSPRLTAQWEDKLLQIEKGQYQRKQFIQEMKAFTNEIIHTIKSSEQKYKHDNLTSAECPTCGKFMLKVKTKNGSMLVCQDPSCKTKKDVKTQTKARCPQCKKRLTKFGTGKQATYRCSCGYTESQVQMDKRFKNKGKDKVNRKDMKKYMKEDTLENNPFKDALKGLNL